MRSPRRVAPHTPAPLESAPPAPDRPPPRRSRRAGQLLFGAGAALVLLGLGAAGGYWLADAGARWLPTMMGGLIGAGMIALVLMIAGLVLIGPYAGREIGRKRIVALTALLLVAGIARVVVHHLAEPRPLQRLDEDTWYAAVTRDARRIDELSRGLAGLTAALAAREALFTPGAGVASADEERYLLDVWTGFVDTALALDQIRAFHEDYFAFDLSRAERERHVQSFLLTFAAELALYEQTAAALALLDRNPDVVKLLELARRERGLVEGSVTWVRQELLGLTDLARVVAGRRYLGWLALAHGADGEMRRRGQGPLWARVAATFDRLAARGHVDLAATSVGADLAPLVRRVKRTTFPVQASVAAFLGDYKYRHHGRHLITDAQLEAMRAALAPGDILLARKNWYLSNMGLPGFWPHALLYVGDAAELAAAFDADPEVTAWVERRTGRAEPFTAYLARAYPEAWAARARAVDPLLVIEAISEGVVQNTLPHAAGDYLAALRPRRLPGWVRARAIDFAFRSLGRPYDFDFDFATDRSLVCTELVWRAYRPRAGGPGIEIAPVTVAGRKTLPANEFARLFATERDAAERQLDLVYYLEGNESAGDAVRRDALGFAATAARSKWDFAQE
ncbi:MAG: YiiX/YebB-like N1pC/P60 family cysteine hydrolase [bacterium]